MAENFQMLIRGLGIAISPMNLFACIIGGIMGLIVGAVPGIGAVAGCSLLLPITYSINPTAAIIMLAGIYYGNMYGGAYSAILLNIPGDSPAVITALEGHPLTKKGLAGKALYTANYASFIGGTIGILFLTAIGAPLARIGLKFGPAETASLIFMALTSIGWLLGDNPAKGLIATGLGVMISNIGMDASSANFRYTFGSTSLLSGIDFIPLVIGMFGLSQVLLLMTDNSAQAEANKFKGKLKLRESFLKKKEMTRLLPTNIRASILGTFIGFLPGAGGTTGGFLSYMLEKKVNKNRDKMDGKQGTLEGICASESANNAAAAGAFIPLLSFGIPGSSTTAVLLGGLLAWGLKPGPLLFQNEPDFVWGLIGSMYIGNIICLAIGMAAIPFMVKLLKIQNNILAPMIIVVCIVGAYANNNSMFDVVVMLAAGVLSYFMQKKGIGVTPLILAYVLAPLFEMKVRQALAISNGDITTFVTKPISLFFLLVAFTLLIAPVIVKTVKKKTEKRSLA